MSKTEEVRREANVETSSRKPEVARRVSNVETSPQKLAEEKSFLIRLFIFLLCDLLSFTVILPLLPSILDK